MKNPKKHNKTQRARRNAAPAALARLPRAVARRRPLTATDIAAAEQAAAESAAILPREDSRGGRFFKALGGGLGTTLVGSLLEHQATIPAKWISLGLAGAGAALAFAAPTQTWRSVGVGAAAAGTSLFGRTIIDEELYRREEKKEEEKPRVATGSRPSTPPASAKKPSNASDIPADALARAYERARLRMALASDAPN